MVPEPCHPIADVCLGLEGDCVNEGAGNSEARYLFEVVGGRSKEPVVGLLVPLPPRMGPEIDEGGSPCEARDETLMGGSAVVLPI